MNNYDQLQELHHILSEKEFKLSEISLDDYGYTFYVDLCHENDITKHLTVGEMLKIALVQHNNDLPDDYPVTIHFKKGTPESTIDIIKNAELIVKETAKFNLTHTRGIIDHRAVIHIR